MSLREGETGVVWRTRRRHGHSQKGAALGRHAAVLVACLAAADRSQPPRQDLRCVRPYASPTVYAVGFLTISSPLLIESYQGLVPEWAD